MRRETAGAKALTEYPYRPWSPRAAINADIKNVAATVLRINGQPNFLKEIRNSGIFNRNTAVPMGKSNRRFKIVAIPVKPPGKMPFGAVNILTDSAYSAPPAVKYKTSKNRFPIFCTLVCRKILVPIVLDSIKQRPKPFLCTAQIQPSEQSF